MSIDLCDVGEAFRILREKFDKRITIETDYMRPPMLNIDECTRFLNRAIRLTISQIRRDNREQQACEEKQRKEFNRMIREDKEKRK